MALLSCDLKEFYKRLIVSDNIFICTHLNPDGDTIGSVLALQRVLKFYGKKVFVYSQDGIPDNCKFLKDVEKIISSVLPTDLENYDLFLFVDCNDFKRVGLENEIATNFNEMAIIDHHVKTENKADFALIDEKASSTAQLVYDMLIACEVKIDEIMAEYLLCGIICDTGAFKFSNTDAHTFYTSAKLVESGGDTARIVKEYFDSKPLSALKLTGHVLNNLELYDNGKIIIGYVSKAVMDDLNATREDTEGINAQINSLKGVVFSAFIREVEINVFRCSFRGNGKIDCNKLAIAFGGGGHINAAGATIKDTYENALESILQEARKWTDFL